MFFLKIPKHLWCAGEMHWNLHIWGSMTLSIVHENLWMCYFAFRMSVITIMLFVLACNLQTESYMTNTRQCCAGEHAIVALLTSSLENSCRFRVATNKQAAVMATATTWSEASLLWDKGWKGCAAWHCICLHFICWQAGQRGHFFLYDLTDWPSEDFVHNAYAGQQRVQLSLLCCMTHITAAVLAWHDCVRCFLSQHMNVTVSRENILHLQADTNHDHSVCNALR